MAAVATTDSAKPGIDGEPRIEHEEHAHGRRQRGNGRPRPPGGQRQQRDRAHRRGADDARARAGEHDEGDERQACDDGLDPPVGGPPAQRPEHAGEDDRDVGAGHGGEVAQPGAAELLRQDRVHGAGVAHRQARQQTGRARLQHASGGCGQTVPQRSRGPLDRTGSAERRRRATRREDGDERIAVPRQRGTDACAHPLSGEQVRPSLGGREQQDVVVTRCRRSPTTTSVTEASATIRPGPGPVSGCGSLSSSRTTVTVRPASAIARNGDASRTRPWTPPPTPRRRAPPARRPAAPSTDADGGQRRPDGSREHPGDEQHAGVQPRRDDRGTPEHEREGHEPEVQPGPRARRPVTRSPDRPARRRWTGRCPARRRAPRRCRRARCSCGGRRSAGRAPARCRAARPAPPPSRC